MGDAVVVYDDENLPVASPASRALSMKRENARMYYQISTVCQECSLNTRPPSVAHNDCIPCDQGSLVCLSFEQTEFPKFR